MNPDQAAERSHPDKDSAKREQEGKGEAHDCPVGYDCIMSNIAHHLHHATSVSTSSLLRADQTCYKTLGITEDELVARYTEAESQEQN